MLSKFVPVSIVAAALALGGAAVAQQQGGNSGMQNNPQTQGQQGQHQQQGQSTQQSGVQGQQGMQGQQAANGNVNLKSVRLSSLDQNDLKEVQTQLKDLGFYKGNVDGMLGNQTKTALLSFFQSQINLARQGKISDQALSGFGFDKSQIEKVRGIDESKGNVREPTKGQETPQQQNQMQQQRPPSQQQQQSPSQRNPQY